MKHLCCILILTSIVAVAGSITITGPEDVNGNSCNPGVTSSCIIAPPNNAPIYEVFSVTITSPTMAGGLWTVSIDTDYGTSIAGDTSIPAYEYLQTSASFGIGDVLFSWNGSDYGLVLTPHNGYSAGQLYKANSFQTSQTVMTAGGIPTDEIPRPGIFVELGAGGQPAVAGGTGAISVITNPGANGVNNGTYTITDTFSAPANFLDSAFTVYDSSYACANGYLTGPGGGITLGTGGTTPEPGSWLLILPGLVLLGIGQMRKRRRA